MATGVRVPSFDAPLSSGVPPLEPGDHLTRDEFERRFQATPGLTKAELLEGVVHMPPAVRAKSHGGPHADLVACLVFYRAATVGVDVYDNASIRLDLDNEPQPDVAMLVDPGFGGRVKISDDDYIEGAPEFVAEVSASTVSIDLNLKFSIYRRNGVSEYIVWRMQDRQIDQFVLQGGQFVKVPVAADGILRSVQFPGFWLDTAAMIRRDIAAVLNVLQKGIASPEHAAFAAALQARMQSKP